MKPDWIDEIEALCRSAGTAFFFKQWGGKNKKATGRMLRGRTFDEFPTAIRSLRPSSNQRSKSNVGALA
jgi:protein gp37